MPSFQAFLNTRVLFNQESVEKNGTLQHCWWGYKLVQPLWKTVCRFLRKLNIELPYDPAIPLLGISTVEFSSVAQSCLTLCDPMNRSTPGLPVHYQLPEFTQTHVHRVSDAIQPSHPLSSPSPPAPNPSQHQSFPMSQHFAWGGQSTGVSALASFLPKKSQGWSPSEWTVGSPCSPRASQESSPTPQFKSIS